MENKLTSEDSQNHDEPTEFLQVEDMGSIRVQADRAKAMLSKIRSTMLAPTADKVPPTFIQKEVSDLCGVEAGPFTYRMKNEDQPMPQGSFDQKSRRREFTLAETRVWTQEMRRSKLKPAGEDAVVITIANFKGGVGKSTTAMTLAQGLSLLGHRVLLIDADPQGSLSTLNGLVADRDIGEDDTLLPLAIGEETSIRYAIRPTYWDGVDLVPAAPTMFNIEFVLPSRQRDEKGFEFWNVLNYGIDDVRSEYDVIIIDTAPALSYGTMNALWASNGILLPLPPNALDFASGAQFWDLFSDLTENIPGAASKKFDFVNVLLSRVDNDDTSAMVRKWIVQTYGTKVLPVEIPKTVVTSSSSAEFATVYDVSRYDRSARTYKRAREAYDELVQYMESVMCAIWAREFAKRDGSVLEGVEA